MRLSDRGTNGQNYHRFVRAQMQARKEFMNWSGLMECTARRAATPGPGFVKPWIKGWDKTLGLIEGHAKSLRTDSAPQ